MKIETDHGVIINSDKVMYYKWADENGGETHIGGKSDWHLTAFFSSDNSISLACFPRPDFRVTKGPKDIAWNSFRDALVHELLFYSFVGKHK